MNEKMCHLYNFGKTTRNVGKGQSDGFNAVSYISNAIAYNVEMASLEPIELFKCSALWPLSDGGSRSAAQHCDTAVDGGS
jgi:hypothetical protein